MPATDHIRQKLSQLPHKPGVYLMKDRFGTVIYVGKARDLRRRVSQYFHPSRRQGWDLKFNALVEAIHDLDVHTVRSEPEAILLEGKLIKEFHPRYNVSFRDDKRFLLLKVNLNDPIPRFTLTRIKQDDGARYFGPFAHSAAARHTLVLARRQFLIRGCRALTPGEADYKHCLYAHLKFCTAPCIGNITPEQYKEQVRAACDFLAGQCEEMATQLEADMKKAAAALDFEKAAQLRDTLTDLRSTTQKTNKFARVPYTLPLALDPQRDLEELARVLQLPAPPTRIEGFDISNISGTFIVASMVSFSHGRPDRANYRRFKMKGVAGQDDFASVAEAVRRRYTRLIGEMRNAECRVSGVEGVAQSAEGGVDQTRSAECGVRNQSGAEFAVESGEAMKGEGGNDAPGNGEPGAKEAGASPPEESEAATASGGGQVALPDLILIDGGRGQLSAACVELAKLGLSNLPVIGLAKEFEEIYRPEAAAPLRLAAESGALKLLQRVRDESHRFANTYNAQLRLKRISESILDEFPGIGGRRKAALLKKFGSVQRLRLATVEEIAQVPGFGGKAAAELKAFLTARPG